MIFYFGILLQTEFVEGEELDHRIRSRINLVDLAGSERCWATQSSGERLRVKGAVLSGWRGRRRGEPRPRCCFKEASGCAYVTARTAFPCTVETVLPRPKEGSTVPGYDCFLKTMSEF